MKINDYVILLNKISISISTHMYFVFKIVDKDMSLLCPTNILMKLLLSLGQLPES